jgi:hypothetical protein
MLSMQKELNPELFGERPQGSSFSTKNQEIRPPGYRTEDNQFLDVDQRVFEVRSQVQILNDQMQKLVFQINEFIKSSNLKFEKLAQAHMKLEQTQENHQSEHNQKFIHLSSKIHERKSMDLKIQEMVDRHNSVLRSFEVRLGQMQKLLAEKEAQAQSAQLALQEAKMEIHRMKRL